MSGKTFLICQPKAAFPSSVHSASPITSKSHCLAPAKTCAPTSSHNTAKVYWSSHQTQEPDSGSQSSSSESWNHSFGPLPSSSFPNLSSFPGHSCNRLMLCSLASWRYSESSFGTATEESAKSPPSAKAKSPARHLLFLLPAMLKNKICISHRIMSPWHFLKGWWGCNHQLRLETRF